MGTNNELFKYEKTNYFDDLKKWAESSLASRKREINDKDCHKCIPNIDPLVQPNTNL